MNRFDSAIYLTITSLAFVLGIVLHYQVRSILNLEAQILYYLPLLLLLIPTVFFWYKKWFDIRSSKPLFLIASGIIVGVLITFFVAIFRLSNQGEIPFGTQVYNFIVFGISLVIIGGIVWYSIKESDVKSKILYGIIGLAYIFFMFSSLKGFYIYGGNVYGFSGAFMRIDVFFSYLFQNIQYTLAFISFPMSIYAKYSLLDE